jgi:glyceraldehyde 3-phosphate dehydrogenase
MALKVGINGFGRIGRNVLRAIALSGRTDIKVVAINDLAPLQTSAHLFEFDSVHGRFVRSVTTGEDWLNAGTGEIQYTSGRDPANLLWGALEVDMVFECTGIFTSAEAAGKHIKAGAKKVLISAPGKDVNRTVVYGVNHRDLRSTDVIVSNASCTTNCLAPVAQVLHELVGIEKGIMTTVHSYTGDQPVLDVAHTDLYRARAAAMSMIPTSTGAAKAIALVLPALEGRLAGTSIRVPTPNVSVVDFTFIAGRDTKADEINLALRNASEKKPLQGVLGVEERPLVSIDYNGDPRSSIVALPQTMVQGGRLVRVLAWYDNEWGFSNRMADTAVAWSKTV